MKSLGPLTWAWLIIVGAIMITPGGIIPIVHDRMAFIVMGVISVLLGLAGFMTGGKR